MFPYCSTQGAKLPGSIFWPYQGEYFDLSPAYRRETCSRRHICQLKLKAQFVVTPPVANRYLLCRIHFQTQEGNYKILPSIRR